MEHTPPRLPDVPTARFGEVSAEEVGEALRASRVRLATFMIGAGVMHFVAPSFYRRIVPRWMPGDPALHVAWSGVLEIASGALVLLPRTRRLGAWLSLATLVIVYPANIQMALDAGKPTDLAGLALWARVPMQIPMLRLAHRHTR